MNRYLSDNFLKLLFCMSLLILAYALYEWDARDSLFLTESEMLKASGGWHAGKCVDCHGEPGRARSKHNVCAEKKYHTEQFKKYTHGRDQKYSDGRCFVCHSKNECQECHKISPDTHDQAFLTQGKKTEGLSHGQYANLRPQSCVLCHYSSQDRCAKCHQSEQISTLFSKNAEIVHKWETLFCEKDQKKEQSGGSLQPHDRHGDR